MTSRQRRSGRDRVEGVAWVADRLTNRDLSIIATLDKVRIASSAHLERLHFHTLAPPSRDVVRSRVLARLVRWGVLATVPRRIGGWRYGSTMNLYRLDAIGLHLAAQITDARADTQPPTARVRRPVASSPLLLAHRLTLTDLYVRVVEAARATDGGLFIDAFQTEPDCWRPLDQRVFLKPDAYVELSTVTYTDYWFLEIDLGTEHLPVIRKKIQAYQHYRDRTSWSPGPIMPHILITVPDQQRHDDIQAVIDSFHTPASRYDVTTHPHAADHLIRTALTATS